VRWPNPFAFARRAPRNAEFGELQETFLIAAVATILVIRTQLWLTNYPQLGGGGLHIAHLLYGGILMVVAIGILVTLLGPSARRPAAVIGGVGFGFFIDELGKFVTADNNYFFQPAAALIYLIFVGLFMLNRAMQRHRGLSSMERISNALDLVGEAARRNFDRHEKARALELLDGADRGDPLVGSIRRLIQSLDAMPAAEPSRVVRWAGRLRERYFELVERGWFRRLVGWAFAVWALLSLGTVVELVLSLGLHLGGARHGFQRDSLEHLSFINIASIVSGAVSAGLVLAGLRLLRAGRRLDAYRMFERALLVSIFVTRVFAFVESQFGAVFGLSIDLLLLVTLRYMTRQERRRARALRHEPARETPTPEPAATPG
jgi:ABC-type multidrug transport system fused ATPase/permease subunit